MSDEKLYAGKYATVEELEEGYKKSLPTFQENEALKKKLEESTKIPDSYNIPSDIALHENDLNIVKQEAKNSGLTQAQFDKLARERNARSLNKQQTFEQSKKELGADNINIMQDFLKKTYPEKVAEKLLNDAITNKDIRDSILYQRDQTLKSNVPGSNIVSGSGGYVVTNKDMLKARDEMNNSSGKLKVEARNKYLAMQKQLAYQNKKGA